MIAISLLLALVVGTPRAVTPFPFDETLARELGSAYVRAHFRERPAHTIPDLDFTDPKVFAGVSIGNRRLVIVTYASPKSQNGAYVVLEKCEANDLLVLADEATTDNIASYRSEARELTAATYVAVPAVCPKAVP